MADPRLEQTPAAADLAAGAHLAQLWMSRLAGWASIEHAAQRRLHELVQFARRHSRFYRQLYRGLPEDGNVDLADLPVVQKRSLMQHFDDAVTDPHVRLHSLERFFLDRDRIGELYRGRYLAWKSSGSTGTPGFFVHDAHAVAVYNALVAFQWSSHWTDSVRLVAGPIRAALIVATGDHYASIASWENMRRTHPLWEARSFSALDPLADLVAQLNDYRPTLIAGYPSILLLLAEERRAGRLRTEPRLLWSGGEFLARAGHARIERAFDCPLLEEYGASEFLSIAHGCAHGWLHVNADWVIVEPVEADGSPTRPGRISHTALVTNLANRVQPLIRYDLGDRVLRLARPCRCGSVLPAIRVEGRCSDTLRLRSRDGANIPVVPLAMATAIEEACGEHRFQVAQVACDALAVRFERGHQRAWPRASAALRRYLASQGLANVHATLDAAEPRVDASGKFRFVVNETA
ncbi:MAG: phenylacetate--CoA ligase family protein [Bacillota bacterium]